MKNNEIAFLGIDGAGKSTLSGLSKQYLENKGYKVKIIPFHKWIFADILRSIFGRSIDRDRVDRKSPYSPDKNSLAAFIKPPIAFIDNIIFYFLNKPSHKNEIFIYDRFICATQIKFAALNYRVKWFKKIWWNVPPQNAIIFILDIEESITRQIKRNDPYAYTREQLTVERNLYIDFAKNYNFPLVNTSQSNIDETFEKVKKILDKLIES